MNTRKTALTNLVVIGILTFALTEQHAKAELVFCDPVSATYEITADGGYVWPLLEDAKFRAVEDAKDDAKSKAGVLGKDLKCAEGCVKTGRVQVEDPIQVGEPTVVTSGKSTGPFDPNCLQALADQKESEEPAEESSECGGNNIYYATVTVDYNVTAKQACKTPGTSIGF